MAVGPNMTRILDGEHIIEEPLGNFAREAVTFGPTTEVIEAGTVLAVSSADNKYYPHDPAGANNLDVAVALNWGQVLVSTGDQTKLVHNDGPVVANEEKVTFAAGITEPQKDTVRQQLRTAGIKLRGL